MNEGKVMDMITTFFKTGHLAGAQASATLIPAAFACKQNFLGNLLEVGTQQNKRVLIGIYLKMAKDPSGDIRKYVSMNLQVSRLICFLFISFSLSFCLKHPRKN